MKHFITWVIAKLVLTVFLPGMFLSSVWATPVLQDGLGERLGTPPGPIFNKDQILEDWNIHFQATYLKQRKEAFNAPYTGLNSLRTYEEGDAFSLSMTLFLGIRLWEGAAFYFNPELTEALGISNLTGLGGLSNGENQKGNSLVPNIYPARAFIRQTWNLERDRELIPSGPNQLSDWISNKRLVFTFGQLSVLDLFEANKYSRDARTQFMNWSFLTHGGFDYAANTRGYSVGVGLELFQNEWVFRLGRFAMPVESNGPLLDLNLLQNYGDQLEIEYAHEITGNPGKLRLLLFRNVAIMGAFKDAVNQRQDHGGVGIPDVAAVRRHQAKWGWGLSLEQDLGKDVGGFFRGNWSDGQTETYAFTEIERQLAIGFLVQGRSWGRDLDTFGLAYARNELSPEHQQYLQTGGLGAFIGDGRLTYAPEQIIEGFYSFNLFLNSSLTLDYQFIMNPAYNSDRGPVNFWALRLHTEL